MCLTQVGTVVACLPGACRVAVDGVERTLINLVDDGPSPGEHVLVGLGRVRARLTAAEAAELQATYALATGAVRPRPAQGEP